MYFRTPAELKGLGKYSMRNTLRKLLTGSTRLVRRSDPCIAMNSTSIFTYTMILIDARNRLWLRLLDLAINQEQTSVGSSFEWLKYFIYCVRSGIHEVVDSTSIRGFGGVLKNFFRLSSVLVGSPASCPV